MCSDLWNAHATTINIAYGRCSTKELDELDDSSESDELEFLVNGFSPLDLIGDKFRLRWIAVTAEGVTSATDDLLLDLLLRL